jgi:hypothetical protein
MKILFSASMLVLMAMPTVAHAETEFVGGFRVISQSPGCRGNYLAKGAVSSSSYHPIGVGGNRNDSLLVDNEFLGESIYQATARFATGNKPAAANAKVSGMLVSLGRFRSFQAGVAIASVQTSTLGTNQFKVVRGSILSPFGDPGQSRKPCVITFIGSYTEK